VCLRELSCSDWLWILYSYDLICLNCDYRTDERYFAHLQQLKSNGITSMDKVPMRCNDTLTAGFGDGAESFEIDVRTFGACRIGGIVLTYCKSSRRCFFYRKKHRRRVDCDCRERVHYVCWNFSGHTADRAYTQRLAHDVIRGAVGVFPFFPRQ